MACSKGFHVSQKNLEVQFMDRLCQNPQLADLNQESSPLLIHDVVGNISEEDCNSGFLELEA